MNLDGSGLKKLTSAGDRPAWSHDGKKIAFSNRGICVMNADGSAIRRLTWGDYVDNRASFAPDDKQLVFASTPFSRPGEKRIDIQSNAEKPQQIYVISLDGQRVEKLNLGRGEQGSPTLIKIPPFVSRFPRKGTH